MNNWSPVVDLSINLGNILTILSFLGGGAYFVASVRTGNKFTEYRLSLIDANIDDFKREIVKLNDILSRQNLTDERLLAQGKRIDDISRRFDMFTRRWPKNEGDEP